MCVYVCICVCVCVCVCIYGNDKMCYLPLFVIFVHFNMVKLHKDSLNKICFNIYIY